jgi:acetyl-CoA acetyltransferase
VRGRNNCSRESPQLRICGIQPGRQLSVPRLEFGITQGTSCLHSSPVSPQLLKHVIDDAALALECHLLPYFGIGNAGLEHIQKYGTKVEHFAKIAEKNHLHSANNPYSQFRDIYTLDEILNSPKIHYPLTKLQCCPTSDGAACAIVVSEEFVIKHGLQNQAVEIKGISLKTDTGSSFDKSSIALVGGDMSKAAADAAYAQAGLKPTDV